MRQMWISDWNSRRCEMRPIYAESCGCAQIWWATAFPLPRSLLGIALKIDLTVALYAQANIAIDHKKACMQFLWACTNVHSYSFFAQSSNMKDKTTVQNKEGEAGSSFKTFLTRRWIEFYLVQKQYFPSQPPSGLCTFPPSISSEVFFFFFAQFSTTPDKTDVPFWNFPSQISLADQEWGIGWALNSQSGG